MEGYNEVNAEAASQTIRSFNYQMFNLNNYMQLAVENRSNTFSENLKLNQYSRGMGGMGLPGDLSLPSQDLCGWPL